jgi:hypothetical protein
MKRLSLIAVLAIAAAPSATWAAEARRFAILIANEEGGEGTVSLRYARSDALKLGDVLVELGGYDASDVSYVLGAKADEARRALEMIEGKIERARKTGAQTSLLFYYSGHARDGSLRLGATRWPMVELRSALARSSADVRIGIIDACQSGAITRKKGGRPGPSFLYETDDGSGARGLVLISSSSDDEDSQESDEISGSYFTHYLASGLRGDADDSGDRRVTLGEVYLYAYHKTIEQTVETRSGVQHPTYSYELEGSGNLVLTDLTKGRAGVRFGEALEGDYIIFDRAREQVAAEVKKSGGKSRRIALPPGEYVIKKRLSDHLKVKRFQLEDSGDFVVEDASMERLDFEDDYAKGYRGSPGLSPGFGLRFAYQSFLSERTRRELFPPVPLFGVSGVLDHLLGAQLAIDVLAGGTGQEELGLGAERVAYDFFEAEVGIELLWSLGNERWAMLLGPRIAGLYVRRSFPDDPDLAGFTQDHFGLSPAIVTGLRYGFDRKGDWSLAARGTFGFYSFGVDENRALFYAEAGLAFGLRL